MSKYNGLKPESPNGGRNVASKSRAAAPRFLDDHLRLLELAPVGFLSLDRGGRILELNSAAAQTLGLPKQWLTGKSFIPLVATSCLTEFLAYVKETLVTRRRVTGKLDLAVRHAIVPIRFTMAHLMNRGSLRYTFTFLDVSEIQERETELRESLADWQSLAYHAPDVILKVREDGYISFTSRTVVTRDFDLGSAEKILDMFPSDRRIIRECLRQAFDEYVASECDLQGREPGSWYRLRFGAAHHLPYDKIVSSAFLAKNKAKNKPKARARAKAATVIVSNISVQKESEIKLKLATDQLRELSARVESVREEERTRIARELHDQFGQELTALRMQLSWLRKRLPGTDREAHERLTQLEQSTDHTIDGVRRIVADLRPPILDDLGLIAAIEWQVEQFQKGSGIRCRFSPKSSVIGIDAERSTAVFRVIQEALTNVARHSGARHVAVNLELDDGILRVLVQDDGKGIEEPRVKVTGSLGLLGMRERITRLGGQLEIQGSKISGTRVSFKMPLD